MGGDSSFSSRRAKPFPLEATNPIGYFHIDIAEVRGGAFTLDSSTIKSNADYN
jgi:hypothetical protein